METTIPYSWYADPEILRREQERIFRSAWQYAGHLGQLPRPGSFFTGAAGRTPVVVTLARDGELRAFLNVCRHRGFPVAEGSGRPRDAPVPVPRVDVRPRRLPPRRAARRGGARASRSDELGLVPVAVGTWGPFVFVNAGPDAEPLADALGSMPAQVAELGLDVDALVHHARWETELDANWKVVCENFLECYHCQVAHPGFAEVIDVSAEAYALDASGRALEPVGPVRENGRGTMDSRGELPRGQFHFLWPNLTVNIFPGRPNISIGPVVPRDPERTYRFLDYFFGAGRRAAVDRRADGVRRPGRREDRVLVEGVQRGVASGALERGVLMGRSEQLIGHFQPLTAAALADGLETRIGQRYSLPLPCSSPQEGHS